MRFLRRLFTPKCDDCRANVTTYRTADGKRVCQQCALRGHMHTEL